MEKVIDVMLEKNPGTPRIYRLQMRVSSIKPTAFFLLGN
jgi:hypothetical protein